MTKTFGQITPKKLLVYYSWPSGLNSASNQGDLDKVANDFKQYDYLVLGADLELASHGDHAKTITILNKMAGSSTKVFGYIDLGVTNGGKNFSISEIQQRVDAWKAMGITGIFFDDFGYDYGVSRQRQNDAVNYVHGQTLKVVANGWNPDEVFGNTVDGTYNPTSIATVLNAGDFYLSESYLINTWDYEANIAAWKTKADKLRNYQQSIAFKVLSLTTSNAANQQNYDQNRFFYAWYGAAIDNHEAIGWGEYLFSCCDPINGVSPFRARPNVNIGSSYTSAVQQAGNEIYRFTNLGKIAINTSTHTFSFTPSSNICTSITSGNWHSSSSWDCGRIPGNSDEVIIKSGHKISLNQPEQLTTCMKILVETGGIFDCKTRFLSISAN
ncbi:hypothetical protein GCM10027442_25300 [Emticicia fontis]